MSTYEHIRDIRSRMNDLMFSGRDDKAANSELTNLGFSLRKAHEEWFREEVHAWTELPLTGKLLQDWDDVRGWCEANVADEDWLIYLPRGKQRAVYFRKPGDAVFIKMNFG